MKRRTNVVQILAGAAAASAAGLAVLCGPRTPRASTRASSRKTVVITGGSRGLGLALAHRYGRSGACLVLAARDEAELNRARHILLHSGSVANEDDILLVACDLTDQHQAAGLIDAALRTFHSIDILINCAGIIQVGPMENQSVESFHLAMNTNFFAALYTIHAALPSLLNRPQPRNASIVNISSIGGKFAMPHLLPYVASKFALTGFSQGLHAELRHKGIRVTTVCPGLLRTGSHIQAQFAGQHAREYHWFALGATTPGVAASATHAASRIYNAVAAGRAEITITPQAFLAARLAGLAPGTTQRLAALVNDYILPTPAPPSDFAATPQPGRDLQSPTPAPVTAWTEHLQTRNNQA